MIPLEGAEGCLTDFGQHGLRHEPFTHPRNAQTFRRRYHRVYLQMEAQPHGETVYHETAPPVACYECSDPTIGLGLPQLRERGRTARAGWRPRIDHHAPADGRHRRVRSNNRPVAPARHHRLLEAQAGITHCTGRDVTDRRGDAGENFGSPQVKPDPGPLSEPLGSGL